MERIGSKGWRGLDWKGEDRREKDRTGVVLEDRNGMEGKGLDGNGPDYREWTGLE